MASTSALKAPVLTKHKHSRKQKSSFSIAKVSGYTAAFLVLVGVIAAGYQKPQSANQLNQAASVPSTALVAQPGDDQAPSVDEVIATDVAASLTEQANLPIASTVANQAVSLAVKSDLAQTNDTVISKPQIVQSISGSRTVQTYTVKKGDSLVEVAKQFGVSEDTIRWANNLDSDALRKGQKLTILPIDGVMYTAQSDDDVEQLAKRFKTTPEQIIAYNDLELTDKPKAGQKLIIPNGEKVESSTASLNNAISQTNAGQKALISATMARASAGNRYAPGNCTWYAYERREQLGRPVGSFWGNANTWAVNARAAGYTVNSTPVPGAVLVTTSGFYGHVAIVEKVNKNGSLTLSEMNYAGFNVVSSRTIPAGQVKMYQYIH